MLFLIALALGLSAEAGGIRYEKTVLSGALLRAGGPGGQKDLDKATLNQLCERGVSTVFYLYPSTNFRNQGIHSCSGGRSLEYKGGSFIGGKAAKPILQQVATNLEAGKGPVLTHCWNGWHAAGEVSAYALMQFCGWSGDRAAAYWVDNIQDKGNLGKYGSILKRIRNFEPFPELRLSESTKARICP